MKLRLHIPDKPQPNKAGQVSPVFRQIGEKGKMNGGKRDIDEKSRIFVDTDMYSLIDGVWNDSQRRGRNFTAGYGRKYYVSKL